MKNRRILILGDINSSHLLKWVKALSEKNFEIHVFTLESKKSEELLSGNVKVYYSGFSGEYKKYQNEGSFKKLLFLSVVPKIRFLIKQIKPDILHSHYASSYGLFGALTGFHPYFVSVWGSDIYSFPRRGSIHKAVIKFVFNKAEALFSTSNDMAREINNYTARNVNVIPFGIDVSVFRRKEVKSLFDPNDIVIGAVKNLEDFYGLDILLKIFSELRNANKGKRLKLLFVGSGAKEKELKALARQLNVSEDVVFTGRIPYEDIVDYHNMISIFANLSIDESFGVSVLEAGACEVPVVASDAGGLPEVVKDGTSGFTVSLSDIETIKNKFQQLINSPELRREMGLSGRKFVCDNYSWSGCVDKMENFYSRYIKEA